MTEDTLAGRSDPASIASHCNLCGGEVAGNAALRCTRCASTPRARATRQLFQALPLGMLAWRRPLLGEAADGIGRNWFSCAAREWPHPSPSDRFDFIVLPMVQDCAALSAAAALGSPRAVIYLAGDSAPGSLEEGIDRMRSALPDWRWMGVDTPDPCSGMRMQGWLAFRRACDAAAWSRQLLDWCPGLRMLPADAIHLAPGNSDFPRLRAELARWEAEGLDCPLWWRDDDLIADGPALRRLADLSARFGIPVLMAVIPAQADGALADSTAPMSTLSFCQHGWNHVSHEALDMPKSEFGAARPLAEAEHDIARGAESMRASFGERFLPVFVPPWNSITPALAARLPALGLHGLSQYVGLPALRVPGLIRVDTHADIVDWGAKGGVRDPDELVERLVTMLQMRLAGNLYEPIGILSHHRAMGEGTWAFLEQLFTVLEDYACVRWVEPRDLFPRAAQTPLPCAA